MIRITMGMVLAVVTMGMVGCSKPDPEQAASEKLTYDQRQIMYWSKQSSMDGKDLKKICSEHQQDIGQNNLGIFACIDPPKPQAPSPTTKP